MDITYIIAAIAVASIVINLMLCIERKSSRFDYDYMIKQGASLEKEIEQMKREIDVKDTKIDGLIIVSRQLRGDVKALKGALKLASKDRYSQWKEKHQECEISEEDV